MNGSTVSVLGIGEWIQGLERLGEEDFTRQVNEYLQSHWIEPDSLEPYTFFDSRTYTRNLIFKNDLFEILALCWEGGQVSTIHNHRDQECWMVMGYGCLENINYLVEDRDPEQKTCKLFPGKTVRIERDSPLEVDEDEPVHQVVNCAHRNERAVSIHIYSRPFDTCEVYSMEKGTYRDVKLHYWSEYGKLVRDLA